MLVNNLGSAYGLTGNHENARKTFEYGLQNDSTYPLFYYGMASYFGQKGDVENATTYLRKTYEHKSNFSSREQFPDPFKDDSFKKLLKNSGFRKFVESLVNGS